MVASNGGSRGPTSRFLDSYVDAVVLGQDGTYRIGRGNQSFRGKIAVDKLSISSRDYRLEKIGDQGVTLRGSTVAMVDYNELVTMHYRLIATSRKEDYHGGGADQDAAGGRPYDECIISECPFQEGLSDRTKDSTRSEVTDFLCLESAATRFDTALQEHNLARAAASGDDQPRHVSQIRRAIRPWELVMLKVVLLVVPL